MKTKGGTAGFFAKHRSELLMWAFIGEILASPLPDYHPRAGIALAITLLGLLMIGAAFLASRKIVRMVVLPIAGIWLAARLLEALGSTEHFYTHLAPVAGLALSVSVLWAIFERMHIAPRDPRSAIAEAFISYLLIAIAFSQLYWVLNQALENPFNQIIPPSHSGTLLYFSMITLSSVGYGGIVSVNPYLRLICALESMAGIFYVAVVVARLVSSYRPKSGTNEQITSENHTSQAN
jgi:ion channel